MSLIVPDFLTHLRTDRRGICVPFVNRWGPERTDTLAIRYDANVHQFGIFQDDDDETVPDFTAQNMQRQRECMVNGLCQVCGRHVPWSRRCLVYADLSAETIDMDGRKRVVVTEPWLDARCAEVAITHCPALIRRRRDEHLSLITVSSRKEAQLVISTGYVDGPLEAESRRLQPAMWAKLIVLEAS